MYEERELLKPIWSSENTLFGGFSCWLDPHETNEWEEYARERDEWKRFKELELEQNTYALYRAESPEDSQSILRPLMEEQEKIKREFYSISKEWFADLVERRRKARDEREAARAKQHQDSPT